MSQEKTTTPLVQVRRPRPAEAPAIVPVLAQLLIDCVAAGASISFMHPLARERAEAFWRGVIEGATRGERILLVAEDGAGTIVGTVQVVQVRVARLMLAWASTR